MGSADSAAAGSSNPSSLRALYGTDEMKNAVHGSDSLAAAVREVNFCFGARASREEGRGNNEEERMEGHAKRQADEAEHARDGEEKGGDKGRKKAESKKIVGEVERESEVGARGRNDGDHEKCVEHDGVQEDIERDGILFREEKTLGLLKPGFAELYSGS